MFGFQCFTSSGKKTIDFDSRLIRVVGSYTRSGIPLGNTVVSYPGMMNDGTWVVYPGSDFAIGITVQNNQFTITNNFEAHPSSTVTFYIARI